MTQSSSSGSSGRRGVAYPVDRLLYLVGLSLVQQGERVLVPRSTLIPVFDYLVAAAYAEFGEERLREVLAPFVDSAVLDEAFANLSDSTK